MKPEKIIALIHDKLTKNITSPEDALYLLSLLYKLVETDNISGLNSIIFYRNWGQHSEIRRNQKALNDYIASVSDWIYKMQEKEGLKENEYPGGIYDKYYFWGQVSGVIFDFQELRFDIKKLFDKYLNKKTIEQEWWFYFRSNLKIAVRDTPLHISVKNCPIKQVCFTHAGFGLPSEVPIHWRYEIPNNRYFYTVYRTTYDDNFVDSFVMDLDNGEKKGKIEDLIP